MTITPTYKLLGNIRVYKPNSNLTLQFNNGFWLRTTAWSAVQELGTKVEKPITW